MAANPLETRLCEDLGIEFPIVAFSHCKDVVQAVVNAGGLAVLGVGGMTPDEIEREIKWLREHVGNKPFGLDVLIPASVPPSGSPEELKEQIPPSYWDFVEICSFSSSALPLGGTDAGISTSIPKGLSPTCSRSHFISLLISSGVMPPTPRKS